MLSPVTQTALEDAILEAILNAYKNNKWSVEPGSGTRTLAVALSQGLAEVVMPLFDRIAVLESQLTAHDEPSFIPIDQLRWACYCGWISTGDVTCKVCDRVSPLKAAQ